MGRHLNLAWAKLDKYYKLTDASGIYTAALVLHLAYTWSYLEHIWKWRSYWLTDARSRYANLPVSPPSQPSAAITTPSTKRPYSLTNLEANKDTVQEQELDEYQRWVKQPRDERVLKPLEYWTTEASRLAYPRLSKMAIDVFSAPAMSDEPERTFSSAGLMSWIKGSIVDLTAIEQSPEVADVDALNVAIDEEVEIGVID
ncbi:hypothetical protein D6D29_10544 [Aureobasidium pullulans]|nr:hypothetical protein D6D29_10544 [Aureobasidium pullulans]